MKKNVLRAVVVSGIVSLIYTLVTAMVYTQGPALGTSDRVKGLEAFLHFISEPFYLQRMLQAFLRQFWLIFLGCFVLLLWINWKQPNRPLKKGIENATNFSAS